ncbi:hypothetical protein ABIF64_007453 [Bradyrhizobium japonicum]|jgi:hypothetical protein|uniref:hypothetical protein n=1 Tax=Bradyrhizobium japonicum TaxID=375 RepID=UPI00209F25A7|nr:hypothetical protein [Bradyrhizobium japonicum]MCP1764705.1 hypothetical protein [Bradyrhizobium japonicum]MCP1786841.1 hypothetical protein [Bradyrhizobium japonicum]MCP1808719.1 hypothetical protein [Bradyrhizobium japonicum]MCP1817646.1 hypothetical protein [Bradyrhizobium japonicum]MCP1870840.1 hypothetical protein [Bradyrhizobium japonicum]
MKKWLLLSVVSSVGIIAAHPAQARSCSDYKAICMAKAAKPERCDGAWKQCMKTGVYIGPESGTNHGQADKR